eukprot:TRINITY_DN936_c0_g1_i1.p1 TRINITY_DN936_c0_g1~~TRINITY_DN936_c0_g1_i1.p1  ORF type:complete len:174 (+),score=15.30 TRINITY_DN936_c0_g1_i1:596-1117(+)
MAFFLDVYETLCYLTETGDVLLLYVNAHGSYDESLEYQQFANGFSKYNLTQRTHNADKRGSLYWIFQSCHSGVPAPKPLNAPRSSRSSETPHCVIQCVTPVNKNSLGLKEGSEMTSVLCALVCEGIPTFGEIEGKLKGLRETQWTKRNCALKEQFEKKCLSGDQAKEGYEYKY